jgi:hypothetical protein
VLRDLLHAKRVLEPGHLRGRGDVGGSVGGVGADGHAASGAAGGAGARAEAARAEENGVKRAIGAATQHAVVRAGDRRAAFLKSFRRTMFSVSRDSSGDSNPPQCMHFIVAGARSVSAHFPRPSRRARPRRRPRPSFPLARAPDVLGRDVGPLFPHQGAQGSRARAAVARSPRRPILLSPARRRHPSEPSPPPARVVSALALPRAA